MIADVVNKFADLSVDATVQVAWTWTAEPGTYPKTP